MWNRPVALAVALSLVAVPALAQKKSDARAMAAARAVAAQVKSAFDKKDAHALAALYTKDGVIVGLDGGTASGAAAIEKSYAGLIKGLGDYSFDYQIKEAHALGFGAWAIVASTFTSPTMTRHVHVAEILVPAGHAWKLRMASAGADLAPAGAAASGTK